MPIVLSQQYIGEKTEPKYADVEGVIYHYPRTYFKRLLGDEPFVYYRPAKGSRAPDAGTYFGYGRLGIPFPDPLNPELRFVDIRSYRAFATPVPVRTAKVWIESGSDSSPQFQSAVREISQYDYHRILIAAGVQLAEVERLQTVDDVLNGLVSQFVPAPKDLLRTAPEIPHGTGYVWRAGSSLPNLTETAALQERARADHQRILQTIARSVDAKGGAWWYNNNIDLFANVGERRVLIEAKSLSDPNRAVDRMRYGMGQLFDYRVRYEAEVAGATPVLAFGSPPQRSDAWIANVLQANNVALVALSDGKVRALNDAASGLPILD